MNKTILALDFPSEDIALEFLDKFDSPIHVKIGMELYYNSGPQVVKKIKDRGHNIFLDLKLHDIPNTVKSTMKNLAKMGANIVNVHCAGGVEMMKQALEGLEEGKVGEKRPICLGVTQLTSTSKEMMNEDLLIDGEVIETVIHYAKNCKKAGLDGVVCSVKEAELIHQHCGPDFLTVTPGIRLTNDSNDDQKRVATPKEAFEKKCDYIVVGRSITNSEDPYKTYFDIEKTMKGE